MSDDEIIAKRLQDELDREIANKAQGTNMQITEDRKLAARLQEEADLEAQFDAATRHVQEQMAHQHHPHQHQREHGKR